MADKMTLDDVIAQFRKRQEECENIVLEKGLIHHTKGDVWREAANFVESNRAALEAGMGGVLRFKIDKYVPPEGIAGPFHWGAKIISQSGAFWYLFPDRLNEADLRAECIKFAKDIGLRAEFVEAEEK